jgi:hypothetical protein
MGMFLLGSLKIYILVLLIFKGMKKNLLFMATGFAVLNINAQNFTGTIDFKQTTLKDTNSNVYVVKDKIIKLDQYGKKSGNVEGSFIFDLTAKSIKWLNPKRKIWGEQKSETPALIRGKCEVSKGTSTKSIQGVKCIDYTVKNTDENTTITYWIATEKFDFFIPLLKLWNRKDKQSVYFSQIQGLAEGSMPLLSEEKQLGDGKMLTKLEVIKINKKVPDDASVQMPSDFTKFDK